MRKFSKVVLVIAAAVGVVGIGLTIGGVSMGATITGLNLSKDGLGSAVRQTAKYVSFGDEDDWNQDWDEIDESDSKEAAGTNGEIYLVDGVSKLDLSIRTGELYLKEYNGNKIKLKFQGNIERKYVSDRKEIRWFWKASAGCRTEKLRSVIRRKRNLRRRL